MGVGERATRWLLPMRIEYAIARNRRARMAASLGTMESRKYSFIAAPTHKWQTQNKIKTKINDKNTMDSPNVERTLATETQIPQHTLVAKMSTASDDCKTDAGSACSASDLVSRVKEESDIGKKRALSTSITNVPAVPRVKKLKQTSSSSMSTMSNASNMSSVSVGKCPPRDMKRLQRGVKYAVTRVAKWGEKLALFLKNPEDESDSGFFKPPETYKHNSFRVGDKITLEAVGYSSSRNRIAQKIGIDSSDAMCKQFCENTFGPEGGCCSHSVLSPLMEKAKQLDAVAAAGQFALERNFGAMKAQNELASLSSLLGLQNPVIHAMFPNYLAQTQQNLCAQREMFTQQQQTLQTDKGQVLPFTNNKQSIGGQLELAQQVQMSLQQQSIKNLLDQQQQFMVLPQLFNLSRAQQMAPTSMSPYDAFNRAIIGNPNNTQATATK
uniref:Uncharacterized protein n=1 Tax=Mucochytrium quahogii TaxID=96639 RepID=A0A7S2R7C8_9STRA|mmetsp:Transcript_25671/g.41361  ORF Transcript_25671/g.41361 Transcript_25671/m.41361 type:complete len:440 (+) Transcript_25671:1876-3195(+)